MYAYKIRYIEPDGDVDDDTGRWIYLGHCLELTVLELPSKDEVDTLHYNLADDFWRVDPGVKEMLEEMEWFETEQVTRATEGEMGAKCNARRKTGHKWEPIVSYGPRPITGRWCSVCHREEREYQGRLMTHAEYQRGLRASRSK